MKATRSSGRALPFIETGAVDFSISGSENFAAFRVFRGPQNIPAWRHPPSLSFGVAGSAVATTFRRKKSLILLGDVLQTFLAKKAIKRWLLHRPIRYDRYKRD